MGKNKAQTRVVVETGNGQHVLFSIRDSSADGSLHLRFPDLDVRTPNSGEQIAVREAHVTVHTSPHHRGNIINATTITAQGDKLVHRMEICTPSPWLLTPLIGRRQWRFDGPSFTPHSKDTVSLLATFDQEQNTLLYGVWVVAKGLTLPPVAWPFSRHIMTFRNFCIAVYYTTIPLTAYPEGDTIVFFTHGARLNDGPFEVLLPNAPSTPGRLVLKNMIWLVNRLADRFVALFKDMAPDELADIPEKSHLFGRIAVPAEESEEGYRQLCPEGAVIVRPTLSFRYRLTPKWAIAR